MIPIKKGKIKQQGKKKEATGSVSGKVYGALSEVGAKFFADNTTDIILLGGAAGASKSFSTLLKNLDGINDPHYRCTIFRRTAPELLRQGGLIDDSQALYSDFRGEYGSQAKTWKFPSGAKVSFAAIDGDAGLSSWLGSQLVNIARS